MPSLSPSSLINLALASHISAKLFTLLSESGTVCPVKGGCYSTWLLTFNHREVSDAYARNEISEWYSEVNGHAVIQKDILNKKIRDSLASLAANTPAQYRFDMRKIHTATFVEKPIPITALDSIDPEASDHTINRLLVSSSCVVCLFCVCWLSVL